MRSFFLFFSVVLISCHVKQSTQSTSTISVDSALAVSTSSVSDKQDKKIFYQSTPFTLIQKFPHIKDLRTFINALKENCHIPSHDGNSNHDTISSFRQLHIYGSDISYYLIEYNFHTGAMVSFPWKRQFLFDSTGALITTFSDMRIDLVKIFPSKAPFLVNLSETAKGNGGHFIYRIVGDSIVNVLDTFTKNRPQTYDRDEDNSINEPYEFPYTIKDINHDGYNDISFSGKIVLIQGVTKNGSWYDVITNNGKTISYSPEHPFKKIPVTFNFIYNKTNGHFEEQEDYSQKYSHLFP